MKLQGMPSLNVSVQLFKHLSLAAELTVKLLRLQLLPFQLTTLARIKSNSLVQLMSIIESVKFGMT